jgi:hypothetical protein
MKICLSLAISVLAATAGAQGLLPSYPAAAIAFLDAELPKMEIAVAAKDRTYFAGSGARTQRFLEAWGLKTSTVILEAYPMCTDAVTDFQIVGLCRVLPAGSICDPTTFIPKFEKNLAQCREAARANQSLEPTRVGKPPLAAQLQR